MSRIFLKTIILSLSLLAIACQGEKKKGDFSTLDKPFVESYNNNRDRESMIVLGIYASFIVVLILILFMIVASLPHLFPFLMRN